MTIAAELETGVDTVVTIGSETVVAAVVTSTVSSFDSIVSISSVYTTVGSVIAARVAAVTVV